MDLAPPPMSHDADLARTVELVTGLGDPLLVGVGPWSCHPGMREVAAGQWPRDEGPGRGLVMFGDPVSVTTACREIGARHPGEVWVIVTDGYLAETHRQYLQGLLGVPGVDRGGSVLTGFRSPVSGDLVLIETPVLAGVRAELASSRGLRMQLAGHDDPVAPVLTVPVVDSAGAWVTPPERIDGYRVQVIEHAEVEALTGFPAWCQPWGDSRTPPAIHAVWGDGPVPVTAEHVFNTSGFPECATGEFTAGPGHVTASVGCDPGGGLEWARRRLDRFQVRVEAVTR